MAGWAIVPVRGVVEGRCTCGNPTCKPGKHPHLSSWPRRATVDQARITEWWRRWPDANVGVATGRRSGIIVLDVDPRHGGDERLWELERHHGELPTTIVSL